MTSVWGDRPRHVVPAVLLALVTIAASLFAVGGAASADPAASISLRISGDQGDYVSGGRSYSFSTANNDSLSAYSDGNWVTVRLNDYSWVVDLLAPADPAIIRALRPGTFPNAAGYPFQELHQPGLDVEGDSRGCNTSTGSFAVQHAVFGRHNAIERLDATFVQHCGTDQAALRGEIHITDPPAPAPTPPTDPYPSATLAYTADQGGYDSFATAESDEITATGSTDHVTFAVHGTNETHYTLDLAAPQGQTLQPGTYDGVARYPDRNADQPGLLFQGEGQGCIPTVTGSFTIASIAFSPEGDLQAIDATFEQHCEDFEAATRGKLRYSTTEAIDPDPSPTETPDPTTTPDPTPTSAPTTTPAPSTTQLPTSPPPAAPATATTLTVLPQSPRAGLPVTLLAQVAPARASGTVRFVDGQTPIGPPTRTQVGTATLVTTFTEGPHTLTAVFTPDGSTYAPSTSPVTTITVAGRR